MINQFIQSLLRQLHKSYSSTTAYFSSLVAFKSKLLLENIAELGHAFWAPVVLFFIDLPLLFNKHIVHNPWYVVSIPLYLLAAIITAITSLIILALYTLSSILSWLFYRRTLNFGFYIFSGLKTLFKSFLSIFQPIKQHTQELLKFPWPDTTQLRSFLGEKIGDSNLVEIVTFLNGALMHQNNETDAVTPNSFDLIDKFVEGTATPDDLQQALKMLFQIRDYFTVYQKENPETEIYEYLKRGIALMITNVAHPKDGDHSYERISKALDTVFEAFSRHSVLDISVLNCITQEAAEVLLENNNRFAPLLSYAIEKILGYDKVTPTQAVSKEVEFINKIVLKYLTQSTPEQFHQLCQHLSKVGTELTHVIASFIFEPTLLKLKCDLFLDQKPNESLLNSLNLPEDVKSSFKACLTRDEELTPPSILEIALENFLNVDLIDEIVKNKNEASRFLSKIIGIFFKKPQQTSEESTSRQLHLSSLIEHALAHPKHVVTILAAVSMLNRTPERASSALSERLEGNGLASTLYDQKEASEYTSSKIIHSLGALLNESSDFRKTLSKNAGLITDFLILVLNIPVSQDSTDSLNPTRDSLENIITMMTSIDEGTFWSTIVSLINEPKSDSKSFIYIMSHFLSNFKGLTQDGKEAFEKIVVCFYNNIQPLLPSPLKDRIALIADQLRGFIDAHGKEVFYTLFEDSSLSEVFAKMLNDETITTEMVSTMMKVAKKYRDTFALLATCPEDALSFVSEIDFILNPQQPEVVPNSYYKAYTELDIHQRQLLLDAGLVILDKMDPAGAKTITDAYNAYLLQASEETTDIMRARAFTDAISSLLTIIKEQKPLLDSLLTENWRVIEPILAFSDPFLGIALEEQSYDIRAAVTLLNRLSAEDKKDLFLPLASMIQLMSPENRSYLAQIITDSPAPEAELVSLEPKPRTLAKIKNTLLLIQNLEAKDLDTPIRGMIKVLATIECPTHPADPESDTRVDEYLASMFFHAPTPFTFSSRVHNDDEAQEFLEVEGDSASVCSTVSYESEVEDDLTSVSSTDSYESEIEDDSASVTSTDSYGSFLTADKVIPLSLLEQAISWSKKLQILQAAQITELLELGLLAGKELSLADDSQLICDLAECDQIKDTLTPLLKLTKQHPGFLRAISVPAEGSEKSQLSKVLPIAQQILFNEEDDAGKIKLIKLFIKSPAEEQADLVSSALSLLNNVELNPKNLDKIQIMVDCVAQNPINLPTLIETIEDFIANNRSLDQALAADLIKKALSFLNPLIKKTFSDSSSVKITSPLKNIDRSLDALVHLLTRQRSITCATEANLPILDESVINGLMLHILEVFSLPENFKSLIRPVLEQITLSNMVEILNDEKIREYLQAINKGDSSVLPSLVQQLTLLASKQIKATLTLGGVIPDAALAWCAGVAVTPIGTKSLNALGTACDFAWKLGAGATSLLFSRNSAKPTSPLQNQLSPATP